MTLDDDVARLLEKEIRHSGASFKEVVNRVLRLGLMSVDRPTEKPFVVRAKKLGLPSAVSYDNVEELIERLEGAQHH